MLTSIRMLDRYGYEAPARVGDIVTIKEYEDRQEFTITRFDMYDVIIADKFHSEAAFKSSELIFVRRSEAEA